MNIYVFFHQFFDGLLEFGEVEFERRVGIMINTELTFSLAFVGYFNKYIDIFMHNFVRFAAI
jgi:hypothetical protein